MNKTGISWTDRTWNPVSGCSKVSQGCKFCYAERLFPRSYPKRDFTTVVCHRDRLGQPFRIKAPLRVFVNSMSDLFHEDVPSSFIDDVFAIMVQCPHITFQILTKRPERMRDYMSIREWPGGLPNLWLGVSVEDQETADQRIPVLLETVTTGKRFISYEPALGSASFGMYLSRTNMPGFNLLPNFKDPLPGLDWVIVGGESGPKAREFNIEWAVSTIRQCQIAGVACFVKQLGAKPFGARFPQMHITDRAGADLAEWPTTLRVQEFPS